MATTRSVQVSGLRELGESLKKLGTDMQSRVARRCTNAGAQVVKKAAIAAVNDPRAKKPYRVGDELVFPGNISRNIIVKRIPPGQTDLTSEHIVAVRGKAAHGFASHIAAWQEFGTVNMPAKPFMTPAFDASQGDALQAMTDSLREDIADGVKKAGA